ncbi:MAG TPA: alpha-E domain-containing protein [Alphaproteobacteria bacterium]|jgi:uncharacterized alpha-E superfamily protein|nr:alpha-E domain-containing protein [Alphaproteobacteria bacterium]
MLLSRHAEAAFWMARYVERVENLARLLDVQNVFAADTRDPGSWRSILLLNSDETRFLETHDQADRESVTQFYVLDQDNPSSIVAAIHMARENARALRPLIPTEMWTQLNVFHRRIHALTPADLSEARLPRTYAIIKDGCQAHTGITEGTFFRDEAWYFYSIGRSIERADQTTRLLDIKYHQLLPFGAAVGSGFDIGQWNSVLRSAAAYYAYRRAHFGAISPATVAGFLLQNRAFPRSVALCVDDIGRVLTALRSRYHLRGGVAVLERIDELQAELTRSIDSVLIGGLHEFLDMLQTILGRLGGDIARDFFLYGEVAGQAQSQSQ